MLTAKRHQLIEDLLLKKQTVTIQEIMELTKASESTIRRDLSELEKKNKLIRVHGGATLHHSKSEEPSFPEKASKYVFEKKAIAETAALLVQPNDCIYLDAGTTIYEMVPHLTSKEVTVVTNGLTHLDILSKYKINTYLLGGFVKHNTRALVGHGAQVSMRKYRFDKCFLGANGIHTSYGFTTPDPEEALLKNMAIELSQDAFILADRSKLNQTSFTKFAELNEATLITNDDHANLAAYENKMNIKVVST
ncbi:DeoR/GlpR family DNA-binding transcription regulator [Aquibacillus koreensis]|uniref:DeoR/GlpR family DNA-binding transcription regulator n=1 Tax=Aquibacillus koreensis TaxID=279446 RepID=A0A9X3WKE5_9BACI|nr:DeoR/GlpR family DNA-binding transcription regulator [Aquibacillus koreensis]MCT2536022.1 DeoR/GlpR family DNA-binding transcription regulator [Aquibacillus koreensis]MDC3420478.1 DeoR/GlpR family DNA-binding transcription regulator [Aquibacillus koreensis]